MEKSDAKINQLINDNLEDLTTPCSVFMTFENEEGVNRAMSYNETVQSDEAYSHLRTWLGDHKFEIKQASEPTDIIWENRHFTDRDILFQKIKNVFLICLILAISFFIMYISASYSLKSLATYPEKDCMSLPLIDSPVMLEDAAIREWK